MEVVSEKGIESLTAQELRNILKRSASPIFTVFNTMKEIQDEIRIADMKSFEQYEVTTVVDMPIFKQIGMKMVMFGIQELKLYQLLFMQEHGNTEKADLILLLNMESVITDCRKVRMLLSSCAKN